MQNLDPETALKIASNASDVTANILTIKAILINAKLVDQDTYDRLYEEFRAKFWP